MTSLSSSDLIKKMVKTITCISDTSCIVHELDIYHDTCYTV